MGKNAQQRGRYEVGDQATSYHPPETVAVDENTQHDGRSSHSQGIDRVEETDEIFVESKFEQIEVEDETEDADGDIREKRICQVELDV